jgi:hypothetical protein
MATTNPKMIQNEFLIKIETHKQVNDRTTKIDESSYSKILEKVHKLEEF